MWSLSIIQSVNTLSRYNTFLLKESFTMLINYFLQSATMSACERQNCHWFLYKLWINIFIKKIYACSFIGMEYISKLYPYYRVNSYFFLSFCGSQSYKLLLNCEYFRNCFTAYFWQVLLKLEICYCWRKKECGINLVNHLLQYSYCECQ